jgi:hypothetical protein
MVLIRRLYQQLPRSDSFLFSLSLSSLLPAFECKNNLLIGFVARNRVDCSSYHLTYAGLAMTFAFSIRTCQSLMDFACNSLRTSLRSKIRL